MNEEFYHEYHKEVILWDITAGKRVFDMPTGTPWEAAHSIDERIGTHPYGRYRHKKCGGIIKSDFSTRWEGSVSYVTRWKYCDRCYKKFDIEEE